MRFIVVALGLMVGLKFYAQEQVYRSSTTEALIEAYRARAIAACQADRRNQPATAAFVLWARPSAIEVAIGREDLGVSIWDIDHALWNAAYKQPYLVLTPADPHTGLSCTYDITADAANVGRRG